MLQIPGLLALGAYGAMLYAATRDSDWEIASVFTGVVRDSTPDEDLDRAYDIHDARNLFLANPDRDILCVDLSDRERKKRVWRMLEAADFFEGIDD